MEEEMALFWQLGSPAVTPKPLASSFAGLRQPVVAKKGANISGVGSQDIHKTKIYAMMLGGVDAPKRGNVVFFAEI